MQICEEMVLHIDKTYFFSFLFFIMKITYCEKKTHRYTCTKQKVSATKG